MSVYSTSTSASSSASPTPSLAPSSSGAAPYAPNAYQIGADLAPIEAGAPTTEPSQPAPETIPQGTPAEAQSFTWDSPYAGIPPLPPYYRGMPPTGKPRRRGRALVLALVLLAVLGVGGFAGAKIAGSRASPSPTIVIGAASAPAVTLTSSTTSLQQSVENVAKAVEPSVVKITSTSTSGEAVGSGDILTANGYIVTNDHVVAGYTSYTVTLSNGKSYLATLVGQDAQDDLAVLKINATGLTPIAFASSSQVTVGEFVVAVGNPLDLQESATLGTVSALNGSASEAPSGPAGELTGLIQTTATIAPGNSGGTLVNLQGQLIGIPTLEETNPDTNSASGIGYAISASRIEYVASQLIQSGKLHSSGQGFLGIQGEDVTPQIAAQGGLSATSGVLVTGFTNDTAEQSPAQQAEFQSGDVITAVNGQTVSNNSDLAAAIESQTPGTKVTLTVERGSSQLTVTLALGERPANG